MNMIVPTDHEHRAVPQHSSFLQKNIRPSFTSHEERDGVLNSASQQPMLACHQDCLSQPLLYNSVHKRNYGDLYSQFVNPFVFVSGCPSSQTLFCQEQGHNMAANASKMQEIVNGDPVSSTVSNKRFSSYSSPFCPQPHVSNFWLSTTPDLQHSWGVSSQLNYGIESEHNVGNESTLDMSGVYGSAWQSSIISTRSESDMVSSMFQSSQGTGQETCQNSGAHRDAMDQTATSSSQGFSYTSGGKNGTLRGKRKLRNVDDGESQSEEEGMPGDLKKRGCSMSKKSRVAEVHNLSERRRRDRINEKMKTLQELIPNCNKVDKASMLEEAIQYLKLLQLQVQVLSMKAMTAYSGVPNLPTCPPTYSPMGMDMGLGMAMGMGMVGMGGTVVHPSASDRVIPILKGSPTIAPTSGTVLVSPYGMGMVGMGGTMLSSTIAPTAAVFSSISTPTAGMVLAGLHDMGMVGMGGTMLSSTTAPTSGTTVVSSTTAPASATVLVNPPGMRMVMGGTTVHARTSDRVVPTLRGSSTVSPTSGTVLDSPQEIYGTGMAGMGGTVVHHANTSDRIVPTLKASSIIAPSSGTVSASPQDDIYVPSQELGIRAHVG